MSKTIQLTYDVKTGKAVLDVEKLAKAMKDVNDSAESIGSESSKQMKFFGEQADDAISKVSPQLGGIISAAKGMGASIRSTFPAFKGLKGAIVSTGIGVFIVLLGELIANFDKIKDMFSNQDRNVLLVQEQSLLERRLELQSDELQIAEARGIVGHNILEQKRQLLQLEINQLEKEKSIALAHEDQEMALEKHNAIREKEQLLLINQVLMEKQIADILDDARRTTDEDFNKQQQRLDLVRKEQNALDSIKEDLKEFEGLREMPIEQSKRFLKLKQQENLLQKAINKKLSDFDKEQQAIIDAEKKRESDRKKAEKQQREETENLEKEFEERIAEQKLARQRALEDQINDISNEADATEEELALMAMAKKYDALKDRTAEFEGELTEEIAKLEEAREIEKEAIQERFRLKREAQREKEREERKLERKQKIDDERAVADAKIAIAQSNLSSLGKLATAFAGDDESRARKAFNINKALGIAQATVNTAQAITKVFAETIDPTPTQSLRTANAIAIGLAGSAQVATIASQKFGSTSTEGGGVSVAGRGGAGGQAQPSTPQVDFSFLQQGADQNSIQAFVIGQDVTNQQQADQLLQDQTRL